jgi:hypothetical protein
MIEFQLLRPPLPTRWTRLRQIHDLSSGRLDQSPNPGTQADGDDRPFGMGRQLICGILPMPIGLQPLFTRDGQG